MLNYTEIKIERTKSYMKNKHKKQCLTELYKLDEATRNQLIAQSRNVEI